jgi:hypothetical protein
MKEVIMQKMGTIKLIHLQETQNWRTLSILKTILVFYE